MPSYRVEAAQEVRRMPAKPEKNWPEKAIDHLTVSANGTQTLVTMYRLLNEPLPDVGSTIELKLGDQDRFDKDRRKASRPRSGGGGGPRRRDPAETRAIQRQHSQEMALRYIAIKVAAGKIANFTFDDVQKMTTAFESDLSPAPVKDEAMPFDDSGLPPLNDIPDDGGDTPL